MDNGQRRALGFLIVFFVVVLIFGFFLKFNPDENNTSVGYYDDNNNLIGPAGSGPVALAEFQRMVLVQGSYNDEELFSNSTLSWAVKEQNKNLIVVPLDALYFNYPGYGNIPAWDTPEITLKAYLLPSVKEDGLEREELGHISVNEDMEMAIIERPNPTVNIRADYVVGKYGKLAVGDFVYTLVSANNRMRVRQFNIDEVYIDNSGRNLFSAVGGESGGLAFVAHKGKPELLGFLNAAEPAADDFGSVLLYYTDAQQVIDFAKSMGSP